ncbi:hypothetical protein BVY03_00150 [bacterium K02(2017)]|nr:hypothetical protein BVY03_00150 [bacterium K02(2017)]
MSWFKSDTTGEEQSNFIPTSSIVVADLLTSICNVLANCFTTTDFTDCETSLESDPNLLLEFGTSTLTSFTAIQTAIDNNSLSVSSTSFNTCKTAIEAVSCQTIETNSAFSAASPTIFTSVFGMIPDNC